MFDRLKKLRDLHHGQGDLDQAGVYEKLHGMSHDDHAKITEAVNALSDDEIKRLEAGEDPHAVAAAAPGGALAALLALLSNPALIAFITTIISLFKKPTPAPAADHHTEPVVPK